MSRLFHADRPHPVSREWTLERIERCETQMWTVADPIIARSIDVVFDLNPSSRDHRDRLRARVAQTRAESKLHYLDVGRATRRARQGRSERPADWCDHQSENGHNGALREICRIMMASIGPQCVLRSRRSICWAIKAG